MRSYFLLFSAICALVACQSDTSQEMDIAFETVTPRLDDVVIAEVDNTRIYQSDIEQAARMRGQAVPETGAPEFETLITELIDRRLLALEGLRQALDQQERVKRQLTTAREDILSHAFIEHHLSTTVNEAALERLYTEQQALRGRVEERRVRQIVLTDAASAEAAIERLDAGASFASLATELSVDRASRNQGGDLGYVSADMLAPELSPVVFQTSQDAYTAALKTAQGWHIIKVEDIRLRPEPSFAEMRESLKAFMTYEEIDKLLAGLRLHGDVKRLYEAPSTEAIEKEN